MGLECCLAERSPKTAVWCFDPQRRVRRWPFPVCAGFLEIFGHGAAGLDSCFWNKPDVLEQVAVESHVGHGIFRGGSRPIFQRARIRSRGAISCLQQ